MYDCAIIGTGAAGVSAALTLKALNKNILWLGSKQLSSKIRSAEKIRNYPGLPFVSGEEMSKVFLKQTEDMGIEITEKTVTGVYAMGAYYAIASGEDMFEAKTVILTTGVESVKPMLGETEFVGRGVSYCATCDGFLYKDKTIGVLCTSKEMEHEIEYLASLAKKVYLVALYKDVGITAENVELVQGMPLSIDGVKRVEKWTFKDKEIPLDGIFMLKNAVTPSVLVGGLKTENGQIVVDRMCATNLKGCFAAGDCTGRPYQYAKAVGEGNVAAHSVNAYLAENK
jgi:thioredoxin reductase (NADPH)